jgi:hypothetical protein
MGPSADKPQPKKISNVEYRISNVEGKRAHKLHHSSFDIHYSIFKNYLLPFPGRISRLSNQGIAYESLCGLYYENL